MIYGPFETEDEARAYDPSKDWTVDPETGRSNSSPLYLSLVLEVERLIRGDAHTLIAGRAQNTARLIVSHLAHKHGLVPSSVADAFLVHAGNSEVTGAAMAAEYREDWTNAATGERHEVAP